jgi:tRNA/tmRNA/rRNA uracil-C5-methylase (TrmA/RlmC/RlmD family)
MVESSCKVLHGIIVKDAEVNYQNNKLENCRIICSKVENVMKELSNDLKNNPSGSHFVACLDPPRAGVPCSTKNR